jgi:hypothetical protein
MPLKEASRPAAKKKAAAWELKNAIFKNGRDFWQFEESLSYISHFPLFILPSPIGYRSHSALGNKTQSSVAPPHQNRNDQSE